MGNELKEGRTTTGVCLASVAVAMQGVRPTSDDAVILWRRYEGISTQSDKPKGLGRPSCENEERL